MLQSNRTEARAEILWGFFLVISWFALREKGGKSLSLAGEGRIVGFLVLGVFYLFYCAKDVSIILLEAPYTSQAT